MRIGEEEEAGEEKRWKTGRGKGRHDTRRRGKASSVMSVLSVTLVYCGQTVGWIKMKLSMEVDVVTCLLYTSPSPRDRQKYRMPSSA